MNENPLDIRQMVMTQDAEFAITEHLIMDNKVHIMLKSNYDTPVLCFLFNRRGMRVDTKMYNPSQDPYISFDVPSIKLSYRVQCSAMNERQKGRKELKEERGMTRSVRCARRGCVESAAPIRPNRFDCADNGDHGRRNRVWDYSVVGVREGSDV